MLCAKYQNNWPAEMYVIEEHDVEKIEFNLSLRYEAPLLVGYCHCT